jgi:hypothetical protein
VIVAGDAEEEDYHLEEKVFSSLISKITAGAIFPMSASNLYVAVLIE